MKPKKTQIDDNSRTGAVGAGRNPAMAAAGVEVELTTLTRTKAQLREVDLMDQVALLANLEKAYARVYANKGSGGVDGIGRRSRPSCWWGDQIQRKQHTGQSMLTMCEVLFGMMTIVFQHVGALILDLPASHCPG